LNFVLTNTVELLIAAVIVAMLARRIRLSYTVGLVLAGVAIASFRAEGETYLTHDLVFRVILPPLLFEAALNIHWQELRRDALPVLVLAVAGTLIAAAVVMAGLVIVLGWPVSAALLFGALIAATDPVAVIAMFKDYGITGRLRLLVESESLFNDGVAAVLFTLALAWAHGGREEFSSQAGLVPTVLATVGGGLLTGVACAGLAITIAGRTADHLIESTLTAVTVWLLYSGRASAFFGSARDGRRGIADRQSRGFGGRREEPNHTAWPRIHAGIMGLHRLHHQLASISADWRECRGDFVRAPWRPYTRDHHRAHAIGACRNGLSALPAILSLALGNSAADTACSLVGWPARRTRPRASLVITARRADARRNARCRLRSGRLLGHRTGHDDARAAAPFARANSIIRQARMTAGRKAAVTFTRSRARR
jgi:hypothetical protein